MENARKITLLLPGCGLNYLWQLGGITALYDLNLISQVKSVYACSGGAWSSIFLGLGEDKLKLWSSQAADFFFDWQKQNKFRYLRRISSAFHDDSYSVLDNFDFFSEFKPFFKCYFKLLQIHPKVKRTIIEITDKSPEDIHKLAIASSTIPFITGTLARVKNKFYLDGGFVPGFKKEDINESDLANTLILLSPYSGRSSFVDFNITPARSLPSGLRLGLPFQMDKRSIELIIKSGYACVMRKKEELLNYQTIKYR